MQDVFDILKNHTHSHVLSLEDSALSVSESTLRFIQDDLLSAVPLSCQMGFSEFYGNRFYVNKKVLIPRPETELLVDLIVREHQGNVKRVLDVGVGSGAILLSLLSHGVGEKGVGADISEDALKVARINAQRLRLTPELLMSDRLSNISGTFDLIVSNPPYIKATSHRSTVHSSVNSHEPHLALYLEDHEYDEWFEAFFVAVKMHLKGSFFMEGHELELSSQAQVLTKMGFSSVKTLKDFTGRDRFIQATH